MLLNSYIKKSSVDIFEVKLLFFIAFVLFCPVFLNAQDISAADFLAPAAASNTSEADSRREIKNPEEIRTTIDPVMNRPVTTGATINDAINAAAKAMPSDGCSLFYSKSGTGWLAKGVGVYEVMNNPVATRIAQRLAFVSAYMKAQAKLSEALNGLSVEGKTKILEELNSIETQDEGLHNVKNLSSENLEQVTEMLLRGFVIYEINDDPQQGTVEVSIVTTPKTMGSFNRVNTEGLQADNIADGLNAILAEIKNGVVPPVGGRIISCAKTGEIAFVGFGSSVVRSHSRKAVQLKLHLQSEKIANMRAADALCGMLLGDQIRSKNNLLSQTEDKAEDFEKIEKESVLNDGNQNDWQKLSENRASFVSKTLTSSEITGIRIGRLPAGISSKSWRSQDNAWVHSVCVYMPSLSKQADQTRKLMENSDLLSENKSENAINSTNFNQNSSSVNPSAEVRGYVGGKIGNEDDL